MTMIRQGDVLLRSTPATPSAQATVITDQGRTILAYGEVTGHAHEVIPDTPLVGDAVPAQQLFEEPNGTRLLVVRHPATLRHEEHGPLAVAPGHYHVIRQVEYTPEAIRNVAD
jgi:hypothetical protein